MRSRNERGVVQDRDSSPQNAKPLDPNSSNPDPIPADSFPEQPLPDQNTAARQFLVFRI